MMLYPAMSKLNSHIPNRYMLVNVVAMRARQIADDAEEAGVQLDEKPVTLAIHEVADGKIDASGMDLTIADYCVTLSLTQLDGIYAVRITVNGQDLAYRDSNLFLAGDVLLTSMDDVVRTLTARLYFPGSDGTLTAEEQLLTQYEGQSTADVVLAALAEGPSDDDLQPLPENALAGMTARMDSGVCQLNVSSAGTEELDEAAQEQLLLCVIQSLQSLEGVSSVQLYVDGTYTKTYE